MLRPIEVRNTEVTHSIHQLLWADLTVAEEEEEMGAPVKMVCVLWVVDRIR